MFEPLKPERQFRFPQLIGTLARILAAAAFVLLLGLHAAPSRLVEAVSTARRAEDDQNPLQAAQAYHRAYEYTPWQTDFLVHAIRLEMSSASYDAAEQDLEQLSALRPLTVEEQVWLGRVFAERSQVNRAVAVWEGARLEGPLDAQTLSDLASIYVERGQWAEAAAILVAMIERTPGDSALYYRLGVLQSLDSPAPAADLLAQAVALNAANAQHLAPLRALLENSANMPPDQFYAQLGSHLLLLEELALSEEAFTRAVSYNNIYADALAYLAYVRARLGKPALGPAQQAVALAPDNPTVRYLAGLTWKQIDHSVEARIEFERAYELDPTNPAICVEIASTHRVEGSVEWAEVWMKEAARLAPDDPRFQILLVQFYVDEEYKVAEEGLPLAQEIAARYAENPEAHDALAWAYFQVGDLDRAQAELDRAMTLDPDMGRAYVHMAQLMEVRGRLSEALWYYQRAEELEPQGPVGALARRAIARLAGG